MTQNHTIANLIPSLKGVTDFHDHVQQDYAFVAIAGSQHNGESFIESAIAKGATVIVSTHDFKKIQQQHPSITFIKTENPRRYLAKIAHELYAPLPKTIVAVTGTNGKTSITNFTSQLWNLLGCASANIGTLGTLTYGVQNGIFSPKSHDSDNDSVNSSANSSDKHDVAPYYIQSMQYMTTPSAPVLYKNLHMLTKMNIQHVAIEASSHGLDLYRLDGLSLTAAAFSNLSLEHLDYHKTMRAYKASKLRLFQELLPSGRTAVINCESKVFSEIENIAYERHINILSYGLQKGSLRYINFKPHEKGFDVEFECQGYRFKTSINVLGVFQLQNILAAIGLVMASGFHPKDILKHVHQLQSVPGRLELVINEQERSVYIDYAHTPDALYHALLSIQLHTNGRLIVLFGCGGDRDKSKRSVMGNIAQQYAHIAIITDDNPRTEDPASIRKDILKTCPDGIEVDNRKKAIDYAISLMQPNDCLLIAGKGHETVQMIGSKTHPFDEKDIVHHAMYSRFSKNI